MDIITQVGNPEILTVLLLPSVLQTALTFKFASYSIDKALTISEYQM